ncbi:MAG: 50S ribosomal protein L3 N(5)-glutamine methyltransferase [Gammaproteobacteria bacterium]|nr:50S ribosomal protein L3 N(5)-glutamine methyltransferase [Gammaproteobacteria bacterium]
MSETPSLAELLPHYAERLETSGVFMGHGTDNAWDEAAYLLLWAMGLPADSPEESFAAVPDPEQFERIETLMRRRIEERVPAAYLTHEAWFCGLPFYVDERVLVPRSPIAELIEYRFSPWIGFDREVSRVLDMCTGSGCIAIACAYAFPEAFVDASDISEDALAVTRRNIEDHGVQDRVTPVHADVWQGIEGRYDLIVSNPPYVSHEDVQALPEEYHREPVLGLVAENRGLAIVERILQGAAAHLTDDGVLVVEVGLSEEALVEAYPEVPFTWLEFSYGGSGVFLLTAEDVRRFWPQPTP